jgi:hypothetical protein
MGHIVQLRFLYEEKDKNTLDSIIRSAPFFFIYDPGYDLYEFRDPIRTSDDDPTPDCAVKLEPYGLMFNALGNYEVCAKIDNYVTKFIEEKIGKIDRVL